MVDLLGKHAGAISSTFADGVGVANPAIGDLNLNLVVPLNRDGVDGGQSRVGGKDDLASSVVLVDKGERVGACQGGRNGSKSGDLGEETHFAV